MKNWNVKSKAGFSLVELMVVVAIIGILATIAIPQLNGFMGRAKQAEAKNNLGQVFSLEKAWIADPTNTGYTQDGAALGYRASGNYKYEIGFTGSNTVVTTAMRLAGAAFSGDLAGGCTAPVTGDFTGTATATLFTAHAVGCIGGAGRDAWNVNELGVFSNNSPGI